MVSTAPFSAFAVTGFCNFHAEFAGIELLSVRLPNPHRVLVDERAASAVPAHRRVPLAGAPHCCRCSVDGSAAWVPHAFAPRSGIRPGSP